MKFEKEHTCDIEICLASVYSLVYGEGKGWWGCSVPAVPSTTEMNF